jgi:hypothetical protein
VIGNEFGAKLIGFPGELSRGIEIAKEHTGLADGQYRGRHTALVHILERLCDGPLHQGHLPRSSAADFGDESRRRKMVMDVDAKGLVRGLRPCRSICQ